MTTRLDELREKSDTEQAKFCRAADQFHEHKISSKEYTAAYQAYMAAWQAYREALEADNP